MRTVCLAILVLACGCASPPVEAPRTRVDEQTTVSTAQTLRDQVDLLFVIDDSASMSPKQEALKTRIPALLGKLDELAQAGRPASYHIGVVTSDLGAPGISCGSDLGGRLQQRGLAITNAPGCQGPVGKPWIEFDQRDGSDNFSATGQTLAETFACMASVVDPDGVTGGHYGCGFEAQLESAYRALHEELVPENKGFLRRDAVLAIVWITDEDDCSVDPTSDLFTADPAYGPLNSFRCARFGVVCDGVLLPETPQASFGSCHPASAAEGGKLTDLDRYVAFFGGLKADPSALILTAIAAPADPVATVAVSGTASCGAGVATCTNIAHSCVAADDPRFFGDPAQRLSSVVLRAPSHQLTSICDLDYTGALQALGDAIRVALQPSCLHAPIADVTHPDCVVEDVTKGAGGETRATLPFCDDVGGVTPCWRLCNGVDPTNAGGCSPTQLAALTGCDAVCNPIDHAWQRLAVAIDRGGKDALPGTTAQVACNTLAIANEDPAAACPQLAP